MKNQSVNLHTPLCTGRIFCRCSKRIQGSVRFRQYILILDGHSVLGAVPTASQLHCKLSYSMKIEVFRRVWARRSTIEGT